jgi:hypothetical protein
VRALHRRVVDEDVDLPEFTDDQHPAVVIFADVTVDQYGAPACLLDPPRRLPRVIVFLKIRDNHVGAFPRESDRHGSPNAGIGTGDEGCLSGELLRDTLGDCVSDCRGKLSYRGDERAIPIARLGPVAAAREPQRL